MSDHIRRTGQWYELAVLEECRRHLEVLPPGLLVDVGAMIGNHTAYLAAYAPHTGILAFEPAPINRALLERNVAPYPQVRVLPYALSSSAGQVEMAIARDNRGWSAIRATDPTLVEGMERFTAEARTLDSFQLEDVRLVKIDTERHEAHVLSGARATLRRCRPLVVVEDWERRLRLPLGRLGYRLLAEWGEAHQTYLYGPVVV